MSLDAFAAWLLLGLSGLLGVSQVPAPSSGFRAGAWSDEGGIQVFRSESTEILDSCRSTPGARVQFPMVVHGAHRISIDGKLIQEFGSSDFQNARSFYGAPDVACRDLAAGSTLTWEVRSYSRYFARFNEFPSVRSGRSVLNVFQETLMASAVGALLALSLIATLLFTGKVPRPLVISVAGTNLILCGYFVASVAEFFGISAPMLTMHKLADTSVWLASGLLLNAFRIQGLFGLKPLYAHLSAAAAAIAIILAGPNADVVQLGTLIPFPTFFIVMVLSLRTIVRQMKDARSTRHALLELLSLASFALSVVNDFLVVSGVYDGWILLSIGMVAGTFFLALDVNERIVDTYRERDYLRLNLEREVERALTQVKSTQAELIHSAKMASLGTLSAGIAHEINNSLNYVNGALPPLEAMLGRVPEEALKAKAQRLIDIMKQGLSVTFGIIQSLRSYSGLNQAALKDQKLLELVRNVLAIIKSRIPENVTLTVEIAENLEAPVNAAGISQVLMNLIVNAVDAMPQGGALRIHGTETPHLAELTVEDSGSGMDEKTLARIFEPFFTTKDVGKGTGLGLHICKTEVERHGGEIVVRSTVGKGTTFTISLPRARRVPNAAKEQAA